MTCYLLGRNGELWLAICFAGAVLPFCRVA